MCNRHIKEHLMKLGVQGFNPSKKVKQEMEWEKQGYDVDFRSSKELRSDPEFMEDIERQAEAEMIEQLKSSTTAKIKKNKNQQRRLQDDV
eukprot:CAMPEP_0168513346 /NCGR_PEP_ID=MMETSP0405-20121227/3393_1 /TAXON_ID=498012 /ORGANISM="Trichosphaerium sp, Strain Am-I-7 wt" /LENGTH=89 /DNA_ID=CAMNT_0008532131 /DNA_START=79 /DNA_END=348 /DNA_ORIENTATION=-